MDITSYILSKKYVDETVVGGGALKGAPCRIDKIEPTEEGNEITFSWELNNGVRQTATIVIKDGLEGADGATPEIGANGHWFIDGVDTGVIAAPDLTGYYNENNFIPLTYEEIDKICSQEA